MTANVQELLYEYALGALAGEEQQEVERALKEDDQLTSELWAIEGDLSDELGNEVSADLQALLGRYRRSKVVRRRILARAVDSLGPQVNAAFECQSMSRRLAPLVDEALADRDTTAWVAANDSAALACLELLEERGRRVPDRVSVVGC